MSEHHAAILGCRQNDQRVIERLALLILTVPLQPGQQSGEDAGVVLRIVIGRENPMGGAPIDGGCDLRNCLLSIWICGVQQTGKGRQLRFRNRRMPEISGQKSNLDRVREPALQSIDINRGVEKQLRERGL